MIIWLNINCLLTSHNTMFFWMITYPKNPKSLLVCPVSELVRARHLTSWVMMVVDCDSQWQAGVMRAGDANVMWLSGTQRVGGDGAVDLSCGVISGRRCPSVFVYFWCIFVSWHCNSTCAENMQISSSATVTQSTCCLH